MGHRKLFLAIFPILAVASVAGTGFAAWYFTSTEDAKDISGTVTIADNFSGGTLSVTNNLLPATNSSNGNSTNSGSFKIVLDQGGVDTTDADYYKKGISVTGSSGTLNDISATLTISNDQNSNNQNNASDLDVFKASNFKIDFTMKITIYSELSKYVSLQTNKDAFKGYDTSDSYSSFTQLAPDTTDGTKQTITLTKTINSNDSTLPTSGSFTCVLGVNTEVDSNGINNFLQYYSSTDANGTTKMEKPSDETKYGNMKSELTAAGVNKYLDINFSLTVSNL